MSGHELDEELLAVAGQGGKPSRSQANRTRSRDVKNDSDYDAEFSLEKNLSDMEEEELNT